MTALPQGELIPGPEFMSFGVALASVAFADTQDELNDAFESLWRSAEAVRAPVCDLRGSYPGEGVADAAFHAEPAVLRDFLAKLLALEKGLLDAQEQFSSLIRKEKFAALLDKAEVSFDREDIKKFIEEFGRDYVPFIREMRLHVICAIAKRASAAGVDVIPVSDEFRRTFLDASLEETEGWQETAHLLAGINNAKHLADAIAAADGDRADEIIPVPKGEAL